MHPNRIRLIALGLVTLALLASKLTSIEPGASAHAAAPEGKDARIKALLRKRLATLEAIAAEAAEGYRSGRVPFAQVVEATRAVHSAELALCETDREREAVMQKMLEEARSYEGRAEEEFKAARVAHTAVLKATSDRLEVEIELERLKAH